MRGRFWRLSGMGQRFFGVAAYAAFQASFVAFILFAGGLFLPRTVDGGGPAAPVPVAVAIDLALVAFFGVVHSLMARRSFKRLLVRVWPAALERSLFVFVASLQLGLLCLAWRPIGGVVWQVSGVAAIALRAVAFAGWGTALLSTFLIDHAALFGLRQAFGRAEGEAVLRTPLLYRYTRHPLYLGMLVGLWAGPSMSAGHALLATAMTAYILVGVRHEERDLERVFGDDYRRYRDEVPMLLPIRRG